MMAWSGYEGVLRLLAAVSTFSVGLCGSTGEGLASSPPVDYGVVGHPLLLEQSLLSCNNSNAEMTSESCLLGFYCDSTHSMDEGYCRCHILPDRIFDCDLEHLEL